MKVLSLFTGIGAFEKALKNIGIDYELIGFSEIDKYAIKSYCAIHNVSEEKNLGDITKIDITKLPKDIDLITHGSPCQDFSVAGKQAGGDLGTGTRSSLMWNTINIVTYCKPKYVIWENVKNLLSKKHRHNFDSYLSIMESLGYNNYYDVLNAKDYGIPQNRERVYTISIRKDIDNGKFKFPEKEILKLRLKDMLEDEVDEKYYLDNAKISKIKNSSFVQEKRRIQEKEYCDAILARDWKDPKCVQNSTEGLSPTLTTMGGGNTEPKVLRIGGIFDTEKSKHQAGSIYDKEQLAPTLDAMQGGYRQPIIEVIGNYSPSGHDASRIVNSNGLAPTVKENHGTVTAIAEPKIITHEIVQKVKVRKYPIDVEKLKETLRNAKIEQDISNEKLEKELNIPVTTIAHWFRKDNCFSVPSSDIWFKLKGILHIETDEFDESIMTFEEKDGIYEKANRVYDENGLAPTLTQQEEKVLSDIRIRKLTPKECWQLMGFSDEDFEKAANVPTSNTQLYKQAGNSIVVNVLEKIFINLFKGE